MARPRKQGLDYFPMDVNLFSGKEIHIIQDQYGADGIPGVECIGGYGAHPALQYF